MNKNKIVRLAIIAAVHNRQWSPDTHFTELAYDFDGIIEDAAGLLFDILPDFMEWKIRPYDVVEALDQDVDEYIQWIEQRKE